MLVTNSLEYIIAQAKLLTDLQQGLLNGARAVGKSQTAGAQTDADKKNSDRASYCPTNGAGLPHESGAPSSCVSGLRRSSMISLFVRRVLSSHFFRRTF